jgi:murein DD-endopeptidase MepM/ murein hydrolase activator NlpD
VNTGFRRISVLALVVGLLAASAPLGAQNAHARSVNLAALQSALRATGHYGGDVDGLSGPGTRRAIRSFQRSRGLVADGIAGPRTRRALGWRMRHRLGTRALGRSGQRGRDVAGLQFLLAIRGMPGGPVDGGFGPRTAAAVARFQRWAGLGVDGIAGHATIAALRRPPARSPLRFLRPVDAPRTDGFRMRGNRMHTGHDFPAPQGTTVRAAGRGCVSFVGWMGGYGLTVVIRHRMGMRSLYAHLSATSVPTGRCLVGGTRIGAVGSTGGSSGPHLHFELIVRGAAVDPAGAY